MIRISLTTFIDYLATEGRGRLGHVQQAIETYGRTYDPRLDHYRRMRNGIIDVHRLGLPHAHLDEIVRKASKSKAASYARVVAGHQKWVGRKKIEWWQDVPGVDWRCGELVVHVKPELAVTIAGRLHLIKLYLKDSRMDKRKADPALHLLDTLVARTLDATPVLLDVRHARAFAPTVPLKGMDVLLRSEAMGFVTMWQELTKDAA